MAQCFFCTKNTRGIDWQEPELLRQFLAVSMKIKPRRKTGLCAKHQRQVAKAVRRARHMALLPFVPE